MTFWDRIRQLLDRAKDEATDVAQTARIRLDIRSLEGRRDHLFRDIGRKVYEARDQAGRATDVEPLFADVGRVEVQIREKKAELDAVRDPRRPAESKAETQAETPTS